MPSTEEIKAEVLERLIGLTETIVNKVSAELGTFSDDVVFVIAERFVDEHGDKIVAEIAKKVSETVERLVKDRVL